MKAGFSILPETWCHLADAARVVIVTDNEQLLLAQAIRDGIPNECRIIMFERRTVILTELEKLSPVDLVIALFGIDRFVSGGANNVFSPFSKPAGVAAKYAFIRLGISSNSLLEGLTTPKKMVYGKISELGVYGSGTALRVTGPGGTDITLKIEPFATCCHEITGDGGMAFLPPSETSAVVIPGKANGTIVVDVTVGQLYYYGDLHGYFGLVDQPVTITVENGIAVAISGGPMAEELKEKLFALPEDCRELVELGHGLSKMTPTGLIGVDESIIDTCHFGFGDAGTCGVHLDVVIDTPSIKELEV